MALPTKEKTWQNYHIVIPSNSGCATLLLYVKNGLKSFGSNPWVVWGSCDGTGGAGSFGNDDGVDRWIDTGDVVMGNPGSNHSWFVLKQPGMNNAAICLEYYWGSLHAGYMAITFFPTGVETNGSATNRPSATNQLWGWNKLLGGVNGTWSGQLYILESTDGQCTRVIVLRGNAPVGFYVFDTAKNPASTWTVPYFATLTGTDATTNMITYALLNDARANSLTRIGPPNYGELFMTSEGWGGSTLGEQITFADDDTGEYPCSPIYLATDYSGVRGTAKGQLYDLWWGSTARATGDTYPGDGSKVFAQFGHLIFPWDGSTPLTA